MDAFDWDQPRCKEAGFLLDVGSIAAGCGMEVLFRAMALLRGRVSAKIPLVGEVEDDYRPAFNSERTRLLLPSEVRRVGALPPQEIAKPIADATVCGAPEAMALATPPTAFYPSKGLE